MVSYGMPWCESALKTTRYSTIDLEVQDEADFAANAPGQASQDIEVSGADIGAQGVCRY